MLAKRIIPCLDVKNGRVVKGVRFESLRDAGDPVSCAKAYYDMGADEICFLDITASQEERGTLLKVVEKTAKEVFVPLTVGGGVRSVEDVALLLRAGADKVSINSAAISNPRILKESANRFGSSTIVCAIDAKRVSSQENYCRWEVFSHGGTRTTGLDVLEWSLKVAELGVGEILLTSMDRDRTKDGYDIQLTKAVARKVPIPVIASGGVGSLEHLYEGLYEAGANAVLAASIFHFADYSIQEAKKFLREKNVEVRI